MPMQKCNFMNLFAANLMNHQSYENTQYFFTCHKTWYTLIGMIPGGRVQHWVCVVVNRAATSRGVVGILRDMATSTTTASLSLDMRPKLFKFIPHGLILAKSDSTGDEDTTTGL